MSNLGRFLTCGLLLTLGLVGCGAPHNGPTPVSEPEGASGDEAMGSDITNPALAELLALTCDWTTDAMTNSREVTLDERMRGVEQRFRGLPPEQVELGRAFSRLVRQAGASEDRYAATVATAEAEGVPGFTCPALERAYALRAVNDQDLEPSIEDDFRRWCEAADHIEGSNREHGFPTRENLQMILAGQVERGLSHPTTREIFRALGAAPAAERYSLLVRGAEAEGLDGWSCEPLERLYQLLAE